MGYVTLVRIHPLSDARLDSHSMVDLRFIATGAAAMLGLLSWACDTEYYCASTMTLSIKIGGRT